MNAECSLLSLLGAIKINHVVFPLFALFFLLIVFPVFSYAGWIFIPNSVMAQQGTAIDIVTAGGGQLTLNTAQMAPLGTPPNTVPIGGFPPVSFAPVPPVPAGAVPPVPVAGAIVGLTKITKANAAVLGVTSPVFPVAGAIGAAANPAGLPILPFKPLTWLQNIDPLVSSKLFAIAFGLVVASAGLARSFGLLFSMFTGRH